MLKLIKADIRELIQKGSYRPKADYRKSLIYN